ncbi:zinc finger CCHC domain-containing protein 8 homolog [Calliphora vicina]|uniref:zinc finger CCHC domain-containing protein 8 homolog n=1 Tax=Calliphora vicina TaxID=7373 RepID=UPI00325A9FB8
MSELNADDSVCIIEDKNVTCITLDDSQDVEYIDDCEEEIAPAPPALDSEMEDGEVCEDESMQKETICEIKFSTKNQYEKFGPLLINILKDRLCDHKSVETIEIDEQETQDCVTLVVQKVGGHEIKDIPIPPTVNAPVIAEEKKEVFEKETSPDLSGISELFTIDTAPAPKIDGVKVPSYKRAIKDVLLDGEAAARKKQKEEEDVFKPKKSNTCFNCGEADHSIRDCTKPHNANRIKNARRACYKTERYHVDIDQRFAHIKPGSISDKLKEAMGLRKGELPFFFYRMRVLGYPPGWLEDAKVEHSGINLFNSDGTKILQSDEDEGEVDTINHKYNISKIYDFPGFNQDPGENFYDDYKYHNVPPLNKNQMKEEFIKTLGDNVLKAYKRKKLKDFPNANSDECNVETSTMEATDMEIEDPETTTLGEVQFTRPPPPDDQPPSLPPPPPATPPPTSESPPTVSECKDRELSTQSPSLLQLEKRKQRLLQELQSNTSVIEIDDSLIDDIIELDEEGEQNLKINKSSDNSSESTAVTENEIAVAKPTVIKESFMGTPVLKFSPYDNLPNGDNFKVGVSDVINFENLPDSTGTYEHMKEVIKKVRNCIHKLHSEE